MKARIPSTHLRRTCKRGRFGLTLVELLVLVAIVGLLAALAMPIIAKARARSRATACQGNLRTLGQGMQVATDQDHGLLPKVYYSFQGTNGNYIVSMKSPTNDTPDTFFQPGYAAALMCPADKKPVPVLAYLDSGAATTIPAGYAYNVSLPLLFCNVSRVRAPVDTVTFFDGDASAVVGNWSYSSTWAEKAITYPHNGEANCLYLDGHVNSATAFPSRGFQGGDQWLASALNAGETAGCCASTATLPPAYIPSVPTTLAPAVTTTTLPSVTTTTLVVTTTTAAPASTSTTTTIPVIQGSVNLNPSSSESNEFQMTAVNGIQVTMDDLKQDRVIAGPGFNANYFEYSGVATYVRFRPKGNGNQNTLMLNGVVYPVRNGQAYTIVSTDMTVQVYNDKRNKQGKANGHWMININAKNGTITPS